MTPRQIDRTLALTQVDDIGRFVVFCARLPVPPVTMPSDPVRAGGLDPDIWHGLGVVGLWAAMDALLERCGSTGGDVSTRLSGCLPSTLESAAKEIDDARHLYAHNFGGEADDGYFKRPRHVLRAGVKLTLASGAEFDGQRLVIRLEHLEWYVNATRQIIAAV